MTINIDDVKNVKIRDIEDCERRIIIETERGDYVINLCSYPRKFLPIRRVRK